MSVDKSLFQFKVPLPPLVSQRQAEVIAAANGGELPPGIEVYPPLKKPVFTECVWLRRMGDFAHVHPVSQPCPQRAKEKAKLPVPPWRKPFRI